MKSFAGIAVAVTVFTGFSGIAMAAPPVTHVRGTITSVTGSKLTIKSYTGQPIGLTLGQDTKYAWVTKSSLSDIKSGDFIGTAATGPTNGLKALEVVIFPASMRGTGEGHYDWSMPAAVANADQGGNAGPVQGSMTNGTVGTVASAAPAMHSSMTNGTVTSKAGGTTLTVSYNNGKTVQVMVPPGAPVVKFDPAGKSVLTTGAKVFAAVGSGGNTKFVAVGRNGLTPPM